MSFLKKYPSLKIIQGIAQKKKVAVYFVGGFLRDYLIALNHKGSGPALKHKSLGLALNPMRFRDFDFAVEKNALKLARSFSEKVKGAYVLLDKERGCARIVKKIKGEIFTFDFADFRAKTFRGDIAHRDFTINTLAVDISVLGPYQEIEEALIDQKKAKQDIGNKRIQMVSQKVFKEDPLRVLRAFSLKAALNFRIEQKTLQQIKKDCGLLRNVSPERIREELFKILKTDRAAENFKAMDRIGLLEKVIPQIRVMYGCKQGGYHHLDVWPHSLETVVQIEKVFKEIKDPDVLEYINESFAGDRTRKELIKLACLLHDIGKPDTRKKEKERISFHAHEHVGQHIVRHIARNLKLSTKERYALENMVRWHLRPGYLSDLKHLTKKSVHRYFRDTKDEAGSILLLSLADQRSTCGPMTSAQDQKKHEKVGLQLLKKYFDKKKEKPFVRVISGNDLIKKLKLKPSPVFGKILSQVEEQQVLGKITTKEEALVLAKKLVKKGK